MRSERRFTRAVLAVGAVFAMAGCATPTGVPLDPQLARNEVDAQLDFWHALPERKAVTNDEAFHALLLFVDGEDAATDYGGRMERMKELGMLSDGFAEAPVNAVRRGTVAVALAKALGVKGGLTMRVFGSGPRYATRELQYAGVYPPSSPQQTFSGAEFLGIIGRAEDYQRVRSGDALEEPEPLGEPAPEAPGATGDVGGGA